MSHWAEINEAGTVLRVTVGNNSWTDEQALAWLEANLGGTWVQTSYNATMRKNFAGVGFTYDAGRDAFIPHKPYLSWLLDEATCRWQAPVAMPETAGPWQWDEAAGEWVPA